jgi:hypothetical protein
MVGNGNGTKWLWYEMAMVRDGYGTKMIFTMVRNGRYEMVMVRNDCNSAVMGSITSPDQSKDINVNESQVLVDRTLCCSLYFFILFFLRC